MIFFIAIIFVFYCVLILFLIRGFNSLDVQDGDYSDPKTSFSILIPFRNEEAHLPALLKSLQLLNYPVGFYEIILINDDSNDKSEEIVANFKSLHPKLNIGLINSKGTSNSPKKEAINQGVKTAQYAWIITTDADCIVPENWLNAFDKLIVNQAPKMIVAPVSYLVKKGFLHKFQFLDFLSLQGITMGMFGLKNLNFIQPFLCNGANLCYEKESFNQVDGFLGNEDIPSGDDVFLLEKMHTKYPQQIEFIKAKDVIVLTTSKNTIKGLIQQRVRWASKTSAYKHSFAKLVGVLVFLTNLCLVLGLFLGIIGNISWLHFGFIFLLKFNIDFVLLFKTSEFFDQKEQMQSYFLSSVIYPFYTILVVLLSFKKNYTWKERKY